MHFIISLPLPFLTYNLGGGHQTEAGPGHHFGLIGPCMWVLALLKSTVRDFFHKHLFLRAYKLQLLQALKLDGQLQFYFAHFPGEDLERMKIAQTESVYLMNLHYMRLKRFIAIMLEYGALKIHTHQLNRNKAALSLMFVVNFYMMLLLVYSFSEDC